MATRFYFPTSGTGPGGVSPAYDSSWELTSGAYRAALETTKEELALVSASVSTTLNSPAGAVDVLIGQFTSAPLSGNQTISGNIKGVIRVQESAANADARAQTVIRVLSNDGTTVRGTLIASNASALANEFATALTNRYFPLGGSTAPSSVNALDGDRVVVEIGYRKHENATTNRSGTFSLGAVAGGTDNADNQTATTANVPWIEFTDNLVFQTVQTRASIVVGQVGITPPTVQTRVSLVVAQVAISLADGVPGTPATGRAWGYILD